jgi:hypothetical protein
MIPKGSVEAVDRNGNMAETFANTFQVFRHQGGLP